MRPAGHRAAAAADDQRHHHASSARSLFDGARVPAANMIGEPGEGWRAGDDVVSHEREPGRARLRRPLPQGGEGARGDRCAHDPERVSAPSSAATLAWAYRRGRDAAASTCAGGCRSGSTASTHGPEGSVDKLLMTWAEQSGRPRRAVVSAIDAVTPATTTRRLEGVPLQPSPERHGRHVADPDGTSSPPGSSDLPVG